MVITVQGYNGKNNQAVRTASILSAMSAMIAGDKTLVIQLLNNDVESVEDMLLRVDVGSFGMEEQGFADDGIDTILNFVGTAKLNKSDFDAMCTPMLKAENRLDVCGMSASMSFTTTIMQKISDVKDLIENATDVYQNIFVVAPARHPEVVKAVNEFSCVDKSIYCLKQGHKSTSDVWGKEIVYVITDFEEESVFTLRSAKETCASKGASRKEAFFKISHNVYARDAALNGTLLRYIKKNREDTPDDVNYRWSEDGKKILHYLLGGKSEAEKERKMDAEDMEDKPAFKSKEKKPLRKRKERKIEPVLNEAAEQKELEPQEPESEEIELEEITEEAQEEETVTVEDLNDDPQPKKEETPAEPEKVIKKKRKGFSLFRKKEKKAEPVKAEKEESAEEPEIEEPGDNSVNDMFTSTTLNKEDFPDPEDDFETVEEIESDVAEETVEPEVPVKVMMPERKATEQATSPRMRNGAKILMIS